MEGEGDRTRQHEECSYPKVVIAFFIKQTTLACICARLAQLTEDKGGGCKARKEVDLDSGVSSLVAVRVEHTWKVELM